MAPIRFRIPSTALVLVACTGCAPERAPVADLAPPGPVAGLPAPSGPESGQPFLAPARDGSVLLAWLERRDAGHALRWSRLADGAWSEPATIVESPSFFVNWADFPSILELPDGRLAAHWLARSGANKFAYDVLISVSGPDGASWSEPVRPHRDGTATEHGFVSLFELDGEPAAVWLDGRNGALETDATEPGSPSMTVRFAAFDGAVPGEESLVDDRSCDCCQTDVALTDDGPVVAYRDRSADEIRDIVVSRLVAGRWSRPAKVHDDGWEIAGCPVNGPAIAARGRDVVVAWYTAARDTARVQVAFSTDAAGRFGPPIRVDDGDPVGRVDALLLDDGTALVSWLERVPGGGQVRVRRVAADSRASAAVDVGGTSADRPSGFPRMARSGSDVVFAWTIPGQPAVIRMARSALPR